MAAFLDGGKSLAYTVDSIHLRVYPSVKGTEPSGMPPIGKCVIIIRGQIVICKHESNTKSLLTLFSNFRTKPNNVRISFK